MEPLRTLYILTNIRIGLLGLRLRSERAKRFLETPTSSLISLFSPAFGRLFRKAINDLLKSSNEERTLLFEQGSYLEREGFKGNRRFP
jgi:hypothetical protein